MVDILRALAAILVLNSHYGSIYPIKITIGAELGVAVFFILSGFLASSINSNTRFLPWFIKRELRLFVPYYLWKTVLLIFNQITINNIEDFLKNFLSPAGVWFSVWISILYIVYYVYIKYVYKKWGGGKAAILFLMGLSFSAFIVLYCATEMHEPVMKTSTMPSKMIWLFCMMLGFYIHESNVIRPKNEQHYWYICVFIFIFLYGFSKLVINMGYLPYLKCMPTVISVFTAPIMLISSLLFDEYHRDIAMKINRIKVLRIISNSSLEIWYVSWFFISAMSMMVFPLNWLCI